MPNPIKDNDNALLASLAKEVLRHEGKSNLNGITSTLQPGVRLFRDPQGSSRQPLLYQSGIIIMLQGSKHLYVDSHEITYKKGDYIVLGMPLPAECEAATDGDDCILGLIIDVPSPLLIELVQWQIPVSQKHTSPFTLSQQSLDRTISDATRRLLDALLSKQKSAALGESFVREIIFHVLNGPGGYVLSGLTDNSHYANVARSLSIIHQEYATPLSVDYLSKQVSMSSSGFHRAFRDIVFDSPVQYIKKIRLAKSRELINAGYRVGDAAEAVGYKSLSQFSREFKRYYHTTPVQKKSA